MYISGVVGVCFTECMSQHSIHYVFIFNDTLTAINMYQMLSMTLKVFNCMI